MIGKGALDKINAAPSGVDSFIATLNALVEDQTISRDVAGIVAHALNHSRTALEPAFMANHDPKKAKDLAAAGVVPYGTAAPSRVAAVPGQPGYGYPANPDPGPPVAPGPFVLRGPESGAELEPAPGYSRPTANPNPSQPPSPVVTPVVTTGTPAVTH